MVTCYCLRACYGVFAVLLGSLVLSDVVLAASDAFCVETAVRRKHAQIHFPVVYQFRDPTYRFRVLYESLHPRAASGSSHSETKLADRVVYDQSESRMIVHFCLDARSITTTSIKVFFGLQQYDFEIPLQDIEEQLKKPKIVDGVLGGVVELQPKVIPDADPPDWLVPLRVQAARSLNGRTVIDVDLLSPPKSGSFGADVQLKLKWHDAFRCAAPGPFREQKIKVVVRDARQPISVDNLAIYVDEIGSGDFIARDIRLEEAVVEEQKCIFGKRMTVYLGHTGAFESGERTRLRYVIEGHPLLEDRAISGPRDPSGVRHPLDRLIFSELVMQFSNGRVFPLEVRSSN